MEVAEHQPDYEILQDLEREVLQIINTKELFEPLIYERYLECIENVKNESFDDIFNQMSTLDPDLDENDTESFKSGIIEFHNSILKDWNFVQENLHKVRFVNVENKPTDRHKSLISTEVAIGTIISNKSDMQLVGYSDEECEILHKLGVVILRQNKLENTLHRMNRVGKNTGFIDPEMGKKKNLSK